MAGTIVGSIEHFFAGTGLGTASVQTMFVSMYNFLNNNSASLGVQRLAYNTGSQGTGMTQFRGMNYYDQPNPAGENAWAVFRFVSASVPFDMLIQWSGAAAFGNAPGSPGVMNNTSPINNGLGIAFAQSADGLTSWAGSTLNNGSDTKGAIVWTSSSISSTIYHPRSNDAIRAGAHGTNRQSTMGIGISQNSTYRAHMIADYDNFVWLYDAGATGAYAMIFFGAYTPMSGLSVQVPYFSMMKSALPTAVATAFGPTAGSTTDNGGIGYPSPAISGTLSLGIDRISTTFFQNANSQPNRAFATPRWDEFPVYVGLFESPTIVGMTGQAFDFIRDVYNLSSHDTNAAGTRAVFGNNTTATNKYTFPWASGTVPGTGITRQGLRFSIP